MHSIPILILDLLVLLIGALVVAWLMFLAPVWATFVAGFMLVYFVLLYPLR